ncbi:Protein STB5 [Vanrija pseudolonga]|uniref:Protein STB5 n=1 Tax=Vanrija pseudolonga TaxID=143232 RepID=A0AAF1BFN2_9TREE|nr:Protein STB5 [Vanrija pseudolonga]
MPTVPESVYRDLDLLPLSPFKRPLQPVSEAARSTVRLARQANVAKPQACQSCQQRKRKCDRVRPQCGNCVARGTKCTFELKITERTHPNYLTNLLASLEEKERRVQALEALVRGGMPGLAHIASLSTEDIPRSYVGALEVDEAFDGGGGAVALTLADEPLAPALAQSILDGLQALDLSRRHVTQPPIVRIIRSHLGEAEAAAGGAGDAEVPDTAALPPAQGSASDDDAAVNQTAVAAWPPYELAVVMADEFLKINCVYPYLRKGDIVADLEHVYRPSSPTPADPDAAATPLQTCHLFLVFAIGAKWLAQRGSWERVDTTMLRNRAVECLGRVLREDRGVDCVSALLLLCLCSIYDWGGVDLTRLAPLVSRLATAVGLDKEPAGLGSAERDRRRALFWSVYSVDRLVGVTFSCPVVLNDADITIQLPTHLEDIPNLGEGMDALSFFNHMIEMRRIGYDIWQHTHTPAAAHNVDATARLHRRLDEWIARSPRPTHTPASDASGYVGDSLFDLYYNIFLTNLYRPGEKGSELSASEIRCLKESAAKAIAISIALQQSRKMKDNYVQFHLVIVLGMSLLYALSRYAGNPSNAASYKWCTAAINEIQTCQEFIGSFCRGWPYARGLSRAFDSLAARCIAQLCLGGTGTTGIQETGSSSPADEFTLTSVVLRPRNNPPAVPAPAAADLCSSLPCFDFFPFSADPSANDAAWNAWGQENMLPLDEGSGQSPGVDLDGLLALVGWTEDWILDGGAAAAS